MDIKITFWGGLHFQLSIRLFPTACEPDPLSKAGAVSSRDPFPTEYGAYDKTD